MTTNNGKLKRVIIFAGPNSQTGTATKEKFGNAIGDWNKETFDQIAEIVKSKNNVLAVLPVWNSHEGEINKSNVVNLVFNEQAKIREFWPKKIEFECVRKKRLLNKKVKKIVSVMVAERQCSKYIKLTGAKFIQKGNTDEAKAEFSQKDEFDVLLCTPNQCKGDEFKTIKTDVANPLNFTSFVLIGNVDRKKWDTVKFPKLKSHLTSNNTIFGLEMDVPAPLLKDEQHLVLDNLAEAANQIDEIPRIIFVVKREGGKCGILFESDKKKTVSLNSSSMLTDDGKKVDIVVKENLGDTHRLYLDCATELFRNKFKKYLKHDFIEHKGTNAYFFGCPALKMFTHGYDENIVKQIVTKMIGNYFRQIGKGMKCTPAQKIFYEKYKRKFIKKGDDFIKFKLIA